MLSSVACGQSNPGRGGNGGPPDKWIVYYGNQEPPETFAAYPFVVFDNRYHPPLDPVKRPGKTIAGYLSAGEASPDYDYFGELGAEGLLIHPSETWKGNQYIDIRDRRWRRRVCDQLVPSILEQGFDGVFLDTIDSPLALEESGLAAYAGMADAAVELIEEIRREFPEITVMLNRAYKLLPDAESYIDVAVAESVYATYDFGRKEYVRVHPDLYAKQRAWLKSAQGRRPELKVFTLDYCDPQDRASIAETYAVERSNGFCPYVTSIDLTTVVPEPERRQNGMQ